MTHRLHRAAAQPAPLMTSEEMRSYSLDRAVRAAIDPRAFGKAAPLELEVSRRARNQGLGVDREAGIIVPFAALARDLVVGTATAGGHLVATDVHRDKMIELLRPVSAVVAAGATTLTELQGQVAIPRMTAGAVVQWVAENAAPTESDPAWDQVTMTPKTAAGFVDLSRRLVLQTSGDATKLVAQDLLASVGSVIDLAAITGTGASNQPRGILNTSGIGSVAGGTNGAAPTYDHLVDLEGQVANANTLVEKPAFVTNSRVRAKLEKTQMFGGTNGVPVWQASPSGDTLKGRPALVSNNVPNNLTKGSSSGICSAIVFGNWSDLLIGLWGPGITLMADPYANATTGGMRLVVIVDVDIALRYPTSFAAMQDALTA